MPLDMAHLDDVEQARQSRMRSDDARREFIKTRTALRRILSTYLDVAPEAVPLAQECRRCGGNHGPIRLVGADPSVQLSVSHTGGAVGLIGVASSPLGVDVEGTALPDDGLSEIVRRNFAPAEVRRFEAHTSPTRRAAEFLDIWTRKEAYLKATGEGLFRRMDSFEVGTTDAGPLVWSARGDAAEWNVKRISALGTPAAVVTRAEASIVRFTR